MSQLIGTAGHVDHGKTTLIQALTGIDADRLPEEKKRGMTIDVGFAYIDLPDIGRVSIVDVPGHEKYLANMLVGAWGIDLALLCIAADEGVKPQTREHLDILDLLSVQRMIVVITRADLADRETREIVIDDAKKLVAETRFAASPLVVVSAESGEGMDELRGEIARQLRLSPPPKLQGSWYMPIDRAFTVKGHGLVVTGTMAQGRVKVGDKAYVQPGNQEARIRAIHWHSESINGSERGRRTALNITGIKSEDIERGQTIGEPGAVFETNQVDALVRWKTPIKHGSRVRVALGSDEVIGRIFLNDEDPALVQLRLERRTAAALNQPLIVRQYSPPDLICGGTVSVPQAKRRAKGESAQKLVKDDDEAAILAILHTAKGAGVTTDEICRQMGKSPTALGSVFERMLRGGKVLGFAGLWFSEAGFEQAWTSFEKALDQMHAKNPAASAIPRERVLSAAKLTWSGKPLDRILSAMSEQRRILLQGTSVRLPSFQVQLSPKQRSFLDRILVELRKESVNTANPHQLAAILHVPMQAVEEALRLGTQTGEIVRIDDVVYYATEQVASIKERLRETMRSRSFPAAEARDALGTSRKYIIPLLEYFDGTRFTARVGDKRKIIG